MKILVIGGSYFLGRVFVMLASKEHDILVVNRGNQPLTGLNVREIHADRHEAAVWRQIGEEIDVVVDFCAYSKGDIRTVAENLGCHVRQYLFISTVDVYAHGIDLSGQKSSDGQKTVWRQDALRGTGLLMREDAPFETVRYGGEAGDYIAGKIALEQELREVCGEKGIAATVLRPALLYGPLNYAPRETVFIQLMAHDGILPVITGADGKFQFLYVRDGAEAIRKCLLREETYGQAYNLCGDEIADYELLADVLRKSADRMAPSGRHETLQEVELTLAQAQEKGFPLPFPVAQAESLLCSNEKSKRQLGMSYTSLEEGMEKTCRAFWDVYAV